MARDLSVDSTEKFGPCFIYSRRDEDKVGYLFEKQGTSVVEAGSVRFPVAKMGQLDVVNYELALRSYTGRAAGKKLPGIEEYQIDSSVLRAQNLFLAQMADRLTNPDAEVADVDPDFVIRPVHDGEHDKTGAKSGAVCDRTVPALLRESVITTGYEVYREDARGNYRPFAVVSLAPAYASLFASALKNALLALKYTESVLDGKAVTRPMSSRKLLGGGKKKPQDPSVGG